MKISDINADILASSRGESPALFGAVAGAVRDAAQALTDCLRSGGTVYACGNGGSATQASHFVAELVGRFKMNRRALPAVALADNVATITALANDFSYDDVFAHQVRGIARKGDFLFALSTSGNSPNVVAACTAAREGGVGVVCLTGRDGGRMRDTCDTLIAVGSADTPIIQEVHLMVIHVICEVIENELFSQGS